MLLFLCINERAHGSPGEKLVFFLYIYIYNAGHELQTLTVSFAPRGQRRRTKL